MSGLQTFINDVIDNKLEKDNKHKRVNLNAKLLFGKLEVFIGLLVDQSVVRVSIWSASGEDAAACP